VGGGVVNVGQAISNADGTNGVVDFLLEKAPPITAFLGAVSGASWAIYYGFVNHLAWKEAVCTIVFWVLLGFFAGAALPGAILVLVWLVAITVVTVAVPLVVAMVLTALPVVAVVWGVTWLFGRLNGPQNHT
jgi:hypothetical protein